MKDNSLGQSAFEKLGNWWNTYKFRIVSMGLAGLLYVSANVAMDGRDQNRNEETLVKARAEYHEICKSLGCTAEEALVHVQSMIETNHKPDSKYKHPHSAIAGIRPTSKDSVVEFVKSHNDGGKEK